MKIKIIFLFILAFGFSQSKINEVTEGKERLLILTADNGKGAQSIELTITGLVSSESVNLNRFEVIDRNQLEKILSEQKLQMSGIIRDDEVVSYGEIASAGEALIVSILTFGQKGVPPKESDSEKKENSGGFWERIGTELAVGVIRSMFSNEKDREEKWPHNIQTSLQAEVRKINVESGKALHSFRVYGEHTGEQELHLLAEF